jgi:hypothetical protein
MDLLVIDIGQVAWLVAVAPPIIISILPKKMAQLLATALVCNLGQSCWLL